MTSFAERFLGDASAFVTISMVAIGDRVGLWRELSRLGPTTSSQLARGAGLSERHVREWLATMACAGYVVYDPPSRRFWLAGEIAAALADDGGPGFVGGIPDLLVSYLRPYERLVETFRTGGGVPQSAYPEATYRGQERFSAGWYEHLLVPTWLPAAGLAHRLDQGVSVCDVGCGGGRALVTLAKTYSRSRFVGYDMYGPNVQRARERAEAAGVADRVQFHQVDAATGLPESFDVITTFDVVHDAIDPARLLASIREALAAGGTYLCLEIRCAACLEDNAGARGALMNGVSVLYCMSTSLAHGGAGLGTCGLHEAKLRELATTAGFAQVERLPVEDPFNALYTLVG